MVRTAPTAQQRSTARSRLVYSSRAIIAAALQHAAATPPTFRSGRDAHRDKARRLVFSIATPVFGHRRKICLAVWLSPRQVVSCPSSRDPACPPVSTCAPRLRSTVGKFCPLFAIVSTHVRRARPAVSPGSQKYLAASSVKETRR